jgi:tRNA G46 methylase TrmB
MGISLFLQTGKIMLKVLSKLLIEALYFPSDDFVFEKNSLTKFEQRGLDQGRKIFEFNYRKNN